MVDIDEQTSAPRSAARLSAGATGRSERAATSQTRATSDAVLDMTIQAFGHIDVLVNNAGITRDGYLAKMSVADFELGPRRFPQGRVARDPCRGAQVP